MSRVQFRWGERDGTGSEHSIDGTRQPLEMQIFAYNEDVNVDLEDAARDSEQNGSSIVILAMLFEMSKVDNLNIKAITENLKSVQNAGDVAVVGSFDLKALLPEKPDQYFRYSGSFTYPPCTKGAQWVVFNAKQTLSLPQLQAFRQIYEEESTTAVPPAIAFNWRPVQPLNGRVVLRSFPIEQSPSPVVDQPSKSKSPERSAIVNGGGRGGGGGGILRIGSTGVFVLAGFASWELMTR